MGRFRRWRLLPPSPCQLVPRQGPCWLHHWSAYTDYHRMPLDSSTAGSPCMQSSSCPLSTHRRAAAALREQVQQGLPPCKLTVSLVWSCSLTS